MRTDVELLELAAKAAGAERQSGRWHAQRDDHVWHFWDPLQDDGDALLLAVKLRLSIIHSVEGPAMVMSHDGAESCNKATGIDGATITRRAMGRTTLGTCGANACRSSSLARPA